METPGLIVDFLRADGRWLTSSGRTGIGESAAVRQLTLIKSNRWIAEQFSNAALMF